MEPPWIVPTVSVSLGHVKSYHSRLHTRLSLALHVSPLKYSRRPGSSLDRPGSLYKAYSAELYFNVCLNSSCSRDAISGLPRHLIFFTLLRHFKLSVLHVFGDSSFFLWSPRLIAREDASL